MEATYYLGSPSAQLLMRVPMQRIDLQDSPVNIIVPLAEDEKPLFPAAIHTFN